MNTKVSVLIICVDGILYFLFHNLYECAFKYLLFVLRRCHLEIAFSRISTESKYDDSGIQLDYKQNSEKL